MLQEKDLDIVLIGSPDHWHALQAIAAIEAGADVYLQKPISVDVIEGEAILAAARKHKRVVQIGTQRKSTPHLIDAKKQIVEAGLLGKIGHVDMCCYFHMRANGNPPLEPVPDFLDYELWTGPAPLRPYDGLPHLRWWRTFMEYGNGIVGDMCVHMLDTVRWMLGLGWPKRITSAGGIFVQKDGKSNITDTQTATFEYDGFNAVWQHRTWGLPTDPDYPWALFIHGEKGVLKASTMRADFIPHDKQAKTHPLRLPVRARAVSRGRDREGHRAERRTRHAPSHARFPGRRSTSAAAPWPTSRMAISRPPVASSPISPMQVGRPLTYDPSEARGDRRRGSDGAPAAGLPEALAASGTGQSVVRVVRRPKGAPGGSCVEQTKRCKPSCLRFTALLPSEY